MIFPPLPISSCQRKGEMSLHWLLCVCLGELTTVDLCYDLVGYYYRDTELDVSLNIFWIL
jgi:hypothetical protein